MTQVDQLNSGFAPKLGIQTQYLDGEGHLVDNSLAGAVVACEQLKVTEGVVGFVSALVVDRFSGKELPAEMLFHDIAMLKHLKRSPLSFDRKADDDIAALDPLGNALGLSFVAKMLARPFLAAFNAAKLLCGVQSAASSPLAREFLATVFADSSVAEISVGAPPVVGAWHRAVDRVFIPLGAVLIEVAFPHRKTAAAALAREVEKHRGFGLAALGVQRLLRVFANLAAKSLVVPFGLARKIDPTATTNLVVRHLSVSFHEIQNLAKDIRTIGAGQLILGA